MKPIKTLVYSAIVSQLFVTASAANLINGDFESGTSVPPNGWTMESGTWSVRNANGDGYNEAINNNYNSDSAIITDNNAKDINTGSNLHEVYSGNKSLRLGNASGTSNSHYNKINQQYLNQYSSLSFAWAAVLQNSNHSPTDGLEDPAFSIHVTDETTNSSLYSTYLIPPNLLNSGSSIWKYSDWNLITINTTALIGHTIKIEAQVWDCYPLTTGGHGGYAYLDAFATGPVVPEPSTYGLIGIGALAVAVVSRRRKKA